MKESKRVSFAAISCPHCPFYNREAFAKALIHLNIQRPQLFVLLGDLFESEAASVHPRETCLDLLEEYRAAADFLHQLHEVLGEECKLVWILGNHDDNLQVKDVRRIPAHLREAIHWNRSEWGPTFRRWHQVPYRKDRTGCYQLGQVIFYHGFDCAVNSDELEGLQMANYCGGHAHRLTIRGHTHRPLPVTQCKRTSKVLLPYWYMNAGTLGPLKPNYMARKDSSQWAPGLVQGEAMVARASRMIQGPQWSAHLTLL